MRIATALAVPLALSGCSLQADWDGSKKLAGDECVLAAQLSSAAPTASAGSAVLGEGVGDGEASSRAEPADSGRDSLTRAELAEALRAHVPEDIYEVLDLYALPEPVVLGDESEERRAQILEVMRARSLAEDVLRGWAQIACGPEVGLPTGTEGESPEWPALSQLQALEGELNGVRTIGVAGATEPDHAVALCEEVRLHDTDARIEVTDLDGFPLALAEPGSACGYHPVLLEGLDLNASE
jgi:hypothetical protein